MTLRYLPVSNAESVQYYTGHTATNNTAPRQSQVLYEGYTASEHRSHITIQHRQRSLAQQRATFSPAKTIARTRAPNRPSTRTPRKAQLTLMLTLQELAGLPCWLGGHAIASGGGGSITSRPLVIKVLLLHLVGLT